MDGYPLQIKAIMYSILIHRTCKLNYSYFIWYIGTCIIQIIIVKIIRFYQIKGKLSG